MVKKIKTSTGLMIAGVIIFLASIITNKLWSIDIDIFGAFIFIVGLIMTVFKLGQKQMTFRTIWPRDAIGVIATALGMFITILSLAMDTHPVLSQTTIGLLSVVAFILAIISIKKNKEDVLMIYLPLLVGGFLTLTTGIETVIRLVGYTP
jgi:hypothetical protein